MNEPWMEFQGKDQISLTKYVRSLFRSIRFLTEICKLWNFLFFQLMKQVLTMLFCCKRTMKLKKHCETLLMIFHIMIIARKVGNVSEKNKRVFVIQSEKAFIYLFIFNLFIVDKFYFTVQSDQPSTNSKACLKHPVRSTTLWNVVIVDTIYLRQNFSLWC